METSDKKGKIPLWVVLFWFIFWQIASVLVGYTILLPSPWLTMKKLWILMRETFFWISLGKSLCYISFGFFTASFTAVILAVLSFRFPWVKQILAPVMVLAKSVPVACFIVLLLISFSSKDLAFIIAFIMVLPIIYRSMLTALKELDPYLWEFAQVFNLSPYGKIRYVILPQILPYLRSGGVVALGLSFKAGIAAEFIGLPKNSIGEHLYMAKIYLDTGNLFAWTLAIVILSSLCEKIFELSMEYLEKKLLILER